MDDRLLQQLRNTLRYIEIPEMPSSEEILRRGRRRLYKRRASAVIMCLSLLVVGWAGASVLTREPGSKTSDAFHNGSGTANAVPPSATPSVSPGWTRHVDDSTGWSVETPADWHVSWGYQGQYMMVGSYDFPVGDLCGPTGALSNLPDNATFVWMFEAQDGSAFDFSPRPASLSLDPSTLGHYEGMGCRDVYRLTFSLSGRFFVVYAAFGDGSISSLRQTTLESLGSFSP